MPKARSRIYWRERGGERRAYGDFRDYAEVGGGREALIPPGAPTATTDPVIAEVLVGHRLTELQERRLFFARMPSSRIRRSTRFRLQPIPRLRSSRCTRGLP